MSKRKTRALQALKVNRERAVRNNAGSRFITSARSAERHEANGLKVERVGALGGWLYWPSE